MTPAYSSFRRWTYPVLVGVIIGAVLAGVSFRLAGRDPLSAESAASGQTGDAVADLNGGVTGAPGTDATGTDAPDGTSAAANGANATGTSGGGAGARRPGAAAGGGGALTATDVGVTATAIKVGIALLDLGGAAAFGAAVPGFDPKLQQKQWQIFIDELNKNGGVLGRKVEPVYRKVNPLDANDQRAACLYFTQEQHVFVVFSGPSMGGDADLCVAAENHTLTISNSIMPSAFYQQARGLLISYTAGGSRMFDAWGRGLEHVGKLRGHKLGLLLDQGNAETMAKEGLVPALQRMGYSFAYTAVVSDDPGQGPSQVPPQVVQMQRAGVDTVLLASSFVNATAFVNQAEKQRWTPQYLVSDFQALDVGTLLNGMPDSFLGAIAISYYSYEFGPQHPEDARDRNCRERWNAMTGAKVQPDSDADDSSGRYFDILMQCHNIELLSTVGRVVGPNLTRARFSAGVQGLGKSFYWGGLGGGFGPGKTDYGDIVRPMVWAPDDGSSRNCTSNGRYCFKYAGPAFDPMRP